MIIGDGLEKEKFENMVKDFGFKNVFFYFFILKFFVLSLFKGVDIIFVFMYNLKVYRFGIFLNKLFDYFCVVKLIVFVGNVVNDIVKELGVGIFCSSYDSKVFVEVILSLYVMFKEERERIG